MNAWAVGVSVFWLLGIVFSCFMLWRNNVAYRIRTDALNRVSAHAHYLIEHGDYDEWPTWFARLDVRSYHSIMWDPFCWRVEQAYPWITSLPYLERQP